MGGMTPQSVAEFFDLDEWTGPKAARTGETCHLSEAHILRADGTWRITNVSSAPTQGIDLQARRRAVTVSMDLTERHEAERALRESEARFRSCVESAPDTIFVVDSRGRVLDLNPATSTLLGVDRETVLSRTVFDFLEVGKGSTFRLELPAAPSGA